MAKFSYKMQSLLNIKMKLEEQKKIAYSVAAERVRKEEERLNHLVIKKNFYENDLRLQMERNLDLLEIKKISNSINITIDQIKLQAKEVERAKISLEAARLDLNKAVMERKIHEKLREKAFDVFIKEVEVAERKVIDEAVSYKYNKPATSREG